MIRFSFLPQSLQMRFSEGTGIGEWPARKIPAQCGGFRVGVRGCRFAGNQLVQGGVPDKPCSQIQPWRRSNSVANTGSRVRIRCTVIALFAPRRRTISEALGVG
jgi:hypothetical protein